jgi:hypothetical protein
VNVIEMGATGREDGIGEDLGVKARLLASRNPVFCELKEVPKLAIKN